MRKKRKFINKIKNEIRESNKTFSVREVKAILKSAKKVNWRRYK